ncbi:hypothetical protein A0H81_10865 [Grifola frondosa]|uniref:Uncharacterized protein n=1 Tax=Grifola frondosa TaxID=5627 RepID=A0A1C7LXA0_GRIFR|nr:hypothetical protein A0H81_10865 [Grifola frondosa]
MFYDVAELSQSETSSLKTSSALARNTTLFATWRDDVKIRIRASPCIEANTLYEQLREFEPPRWLNDIEVPEQVYKGQGDYFRQLKEWGDSSAVNADTYNLRTLLPTLCYSFLKIKNSTLKNEASQRRGIDDIIEFAFGVEKYRLDILIKSPIRLRESPNIAVSPNAIADILVTFPVTNLEGSVLVDDFFEAAGSAAAPNAWWSPTPPRYISVIVFPSEYKRPDLVTNCNQVIIDFCTAQSQRRSLGAENDIIFGMAAARGEAVVYSYDVLRRI